MSRRAALKLAKTRIAAAKKYPGLAQLTGAYLTLDWDYEYGDPWVAVEDFARGAFELADGLRSEVDRLLADIPSEDGLKQLINEVFFSGYSLEADGWSYRGWLTEVVRRVDEVRRAM